MYTLDLCPCHFLSLSKSCLRHTPSRNHHLPSFFHILHPTLFQKALCILFNIQLRSTTIYLLHYHYDPNTNSYHISPGQLQKPYYWYFCFHLSLTFIHIALRALDILCHIITLIHTMLLLFILL